MERWGPREEVKAPHSEPVEKEEAKKERKTASISIFLCKLRNKADALVRV